MMIHWHSDEWFDLARITRHQHFDIIVRPVNVTSGEYCHADIHSRISTARRRATRAAATAAATAVAAAAAAASASATSSSFSGAIALENQGRKHRYRGRDELI